jgi:hypothetical protein
VTISRAEYNMLADVTAQILDNVREPSTGLIGQRIISTMCNALKSNNPRFNIQKFVSAVVEAEKKYNPDVPF